MLNSNGMEYRPDLGIIDINDSQSSFYTLIITDNLLSHQAVIDFVQLIT